MQSLNEINFKEVMDNHLHVLVWFYADWCGYCRSMLPEVETYRDLPVFICDADICTVLTAKFAVDSVPCLLLFEKGKVKKKAVGEMKIKEIREFFRGPY